LKRIIKRDLGSDLREINIFVGLTLIIFFVAVGFPTLLNTSPSYGYEGVEWTPVTTMYQEAYAQQDLMLTLATYNFNPFVSSAFLVIPTTIDNPPPDPTQYFELKYGQPISLESGFVETIKPEYILVKDYYLQVQEGSGVPLEWLELYHYVEKPVFKNLIDDFDNPLIQSAEAYSVYVTPHASSQVRNDITDISTTCSANALPLGGTILGSAFGVSNDDDNFAGFCEVAVYTYNPQIPIELMDSITLLSQGQRILGTDTNYDCGISRMQGVPTAHVSFGEMNAGETWFNVTAKIQWAGNFNSPICRDGFDFVGKDLQYASSVSGLADTIARFETNTHTDGSAVCDPADPTQCFFTISIVSNTHPNRVSIDKSANWDREYLRIQIVPEQNATDGIWQMKEHSFYPNGIMDDCGFERVGDLFRIDSGSTDAEQGQCVIFKTVDKIGEGTPDIRINVNASGTGSSEMRVFVDVFDGAMNMGTSYESNVPIAPLQVLVSDFFEGQLREDLGSGLNHRLGIIEVDLPFEGEILLKPNYEFGSENEYTVFVGLQDNSTDGTIILDINSVTIGTNVYDFNQPVVRFHEHTSLSNPSPIKAELDTGYVSTNVSQAVILTNLAFYDKQESLSPTSENISWILPLTGTTTGGSGTVSVVTGKFNNALSYPDPNNNKVSQFNVPSADVSTLLDGLGDGSGLSINWWGKHSDAPFQRNIVEIGQGSFNKWLRLTESISTPNLNVATANLDGSQIANFHGGFFIDDDGLFHMYSVTFNSTHYDFWRDGVKLGTSTHGVTGVTGTVDSHIGWGGGMVNLAPIIKLT